MVRFADRQRSIASQRVLQNDDWPLSGVGSGSGWGLSPPASMAYDANGRNSPQGAQSSTDVLAIAAEENAGEESEEEVVVAGRGLASLHPAAEHEKKGKCRQGGMNNAGEIELGHDQEHTMETLPSRVR